METNSYYLNEEINTIFLSVENRYFIYNFNSYRFMELNKALFLLFYKWDGQINNYFRAKINELGMTYEVIEKCIENLEFHRKMEPKQRNIDLSLCKPGSLWLLVTDKCNLMCTYCYHNEEFKSKYLSNMDFEVAKKAIDLYLEHCKRENMSITFFGGEPLINFDLIKQIVNYVEGKDIGTGKTMTYAVVTNAVLVTKEISQYMKEKNFFVTVSIDGDEIRHNKTRKNINGEGSFNSVKKGVEILRKDMDYLTARITVTKENISNLQECAQELFNRGFDSVAYKLAGACKESLVVNENDIHTLEKQIEKISDVFLKNLMCGDIKVIDRNLYWMKKIHGKPVVSECLLVVNGKLVVDPKGNFYGCQETVGNKNFIIGDVNEGINDHKVEKLRPPMLAQRKGCKDCFLNGICDGTCYYASYSKYGNFDIPIKESCVEIKKSFIESLYAYAYLYIKQPEYLQLLLKCNYSDLPVIKKWYMDNIN